MQKKASFSSWAKSFFRHFLQKMAENDCKKFLLRMERLADGADFIMLDVLRYIFLPYMLEKKDKNVRCCANYFFPLHMREKNARCFARYFFPYM